MTTYRLIGNKITDRITLVGTQIDPLEAEIARLHEAVDAASKAADKLTAALKARKEGAR